MIDLIISPIHNIDYFKRFLFSFQKFKPKYEYQLVIAVTDNKDEILEELNKTKELINWTFYSFDQQYNDAQLLNFLFEQAESELIGLINPYIVIFKDSLNQFDIKDLQFHILKRKIILMFKAGVIHELAKQALDKYGSNLYKEYSDFFIKNYEIKSFATNFITFLSKDIYNEIGGFNENDENYFYDFIERGCKQKHSIGWIENFVLFQDHTIINRKIKMEKKEFKRRKLICNNIYTNGNSRVVETCLSEKLKK